MIMRLGLGLSRKKRGPATPMFPILAGEDDARNRLNLAPSRALQQALFITNSFADWSDGKTLFDHSAVRRGGVQHPAILSNSPCLTFDGVDDSVEFTSAPTGLHGATGATIMGWVWRNTGFVGQGMLFSTSTTQFELRLTSGFMQIVATKAGHATFTPYYNASWPQNQWVHCAITWSSGQMKMFVGGAEVALTGTSLATFADLQWDSTWRLGLRTAGTFPLAGRLAGFWVYNRVLDAAEILAHKNGAWASTTGLQLYLPMCEQGGDKIHDASGVTNAIGTASTTAIHVAANTQPHLHHCFGYGLSCYQNTANPDTVPRICIPFNVSSTAISHATPSGTTFDYANAGHAILRGPSTRIDCKAGTTAGWMDGLQLETSLNYSTSIRIQPLSWRTTTIARRDQLFAFSDGVWYYDSRDFVDRPEPVWANLTVNGNQNPWDPDSWDDYIASGSSVENRDFRLLAMNPTTIAAAKATCVSKSIPLILNFEVVPWSTLAETNAWNLDHQDGIDKMLEWFAAVRDVKPSDIPLGIYAEFPERSWWIPIQYHGTILLPSDPYWASQTANFTAQYNAWMARNAAFQPLADEVDYICPSLYLFYRIDAPQIDFGPVYTRAVQRWAYAHYNMLAAANYGKPLIPFIHPRLTGEKISQDFDIVIPPAEYETFLSYILNDDSKPEAILNWDYYGYPGGWTAAGPSFEAIRLALR